MGRGEVVVVQQGLMDNLGTGVSCYGLCIQLIS